MLRRVLAFSDELGSSSFVSRAFMLRSSWRHAPPSSLAPALYGSSSFCSCRQFYVSWLAEWLFTLLSFLSQVIGIGPSCSFGSLVGFGGLQVIS